jgi:hypothetical protein
VPNDEYRLKLQDAGDTFVRSISVRGKELQGQRIVVTAGEAYGPIEVELSNKAASLEGTISGNGQASSKASVVVQSIDEGDMQTVETDQRQHFSVVGLRPGGYRLFAWTSLHDVEYRNPEYLSRFANQCTAVVLNEAEHVTEVTVQLLANPN